MSHSGNYNHFVLYKKTELMMIVGYFIPSFKSSRLLQPDQE